MGLFAKEKPTPSGHLRVHANARGEVTGVEVLSALEPHEVEPALEKALFALEPRRVPHREERLEQHLKQLRKQAGVVDRLRGRAIEREEAAQEVVPAERFSGRAGPLLLMVDGRLALVSLRVEGGASAREAGGFVHRALEEACRACEARWAEVILHSDEEDEEGDNAQGAPADPEG